MLVKILELLKCSFQPWMYRRLGGDVVGVEILKHKHVYVKEPGRTSEMGRLCSC